MLLEPGAFLVICDAVIVLEVVAGSTVIKLLYFKRWFYVIHSNMTMVFIIFGVKALFCCSTNNLIRRK